MSGSKKATIIVHSGSFDKVMSAFILGNGFLSMGVPVTLFFTFWGLNALTKNGFKKLPLSKLNFFGLGKFLIKFKMKKKNIASLDILAESYKKLGGKIIACTMTMELMGITKSKLNTDFIDDYATVGRYCAETLNANITLFI